jgi:hypothetical protein
MCKSLFILIVVLCAALRSGAQIFSVNLAPDHVAKIEQGKTGYKKLKRYYRFYRQDSIRQLKTLDRHYKKLLDSLFRANRKIQRRKRDTDNRLTGLRKDSLSLRAKLIQCRQVRIDSIVSGSLGHVVQNLDSTTSLDTLFHGESNGTMDTLAFKNLYRINSNDSSSMVRMLQNSKKLQDAQSAVRKQKEFEMINGLSSEPGQYMNKHQSLREINEDSMTSFAKSQALMKATNLFDEGVPQLRTIQEKIGKLLSRYREFSNSGDLSDGMKYSSMRDRKIEERIFIGGNINVVNLTPLSIDLSPQLGYRLKQNLIAGIALNYRATFSDSIPGSHYISPRNMSYKFFGNYGFVDSFFATIEWERSYVRDKTQDNVARRWRENYFVGIGKKLAVHSKIDIVIVAMYNLNNDSKNCIHPSRFQIRTGFQLTEYATQRKKINYNPNQ